MRRCACDSVCANVQGGEDHEVLIDGYVTMLNKLTNSLVSAQRAYSDVFAQFVYYSSILSLLFYILYYKLTTTDPANDFRLWFFTCNST